MKIRLKRLRVGEWATKDKLHKPKDDGYYLLIYKYSQFDAYIKDLIATCVKSNT